MDTAELHELGMLPWAKLRNALHAGDQAKALTLCEKLPKEFVLMHVGLRYMLTVLLDYIEPFFRSEQATIVEKIKGAVVARDKVKALDLIDEKREKQYRPLHDMLLEIKAGSYDYVLRQYGPEELFQCQRYVAEGQREGFTKQISGPLEDMVRTFAYTASLHLGKTTVTEDKHRYTVTLDPCGSGGSMVRNNQVEPAGHHAQVHGPRPVTFNREAFPAYCSHCAVWDEIAGIEWFGFPIRVFEPWQSADEPCTCHMYKDPNDIPEEHWTMFGFEKPSNLPKPNRNYALSGEELAGLGMLPSSAVVSALEENDFDLALRLCDQLPKEYMLMVKGLIVVARVILDYHERLFRREQVAIAARIKDAVAAGDLGQAESLIERKIDQHRGVHDLYTAFVATTFSWLFTSFGQEELYKCLYYVGERHRAGFEAWAKLPAEEYVRVAANLYAQHPDGQMTIEEDEHKFVISCAPCGSGGKLELAGDYDPPNPKYARIAKPSPLTFGRSDFPVYCSHCAALNAIVPLELLGRPLCANIPMRTAGGPCLAIIYKDTRNIPEEFYRSIGREKPIS